VNIIGKKQEKVEIPTSLTIWINEGTTDAYKEIVEWFKKYAPEYAKTTITFEKQVRDPIQYRTLLLNTIADGKGPDIFMIHAGEDIVLEGKIEPIPWDMLPLADFDKKYETLFLPLIISSGSTKDDGEYLLGVPMGYETLGIFYNKSLIRTFPKTWNELDTLYSEGLPSGKYPSNLGMSPRYTPNMSDIIGLFLGKEDILSYRTLSSANKSFTSYIRYGEMPVGRWETTETDIYSPNTSLLENTPLMDREKTTTIDMFMRGEIGMVFGYQSLIEDLEKAQKRAASEAVNDIILTERIPQDSWNGKKKNIARYAYFWISKSSNNGIAGVKFLEYLMTEDALQKYLKSHPYMIAAQTKFYTAQEAARLSSVLARTRLDSFIPELDETLFVFDYGMKSEFERFLDKYIDRNDKWDINNLWSLLSRTIQCAVGPYTTGTNLSDCDNLE
jgi:ABC-type glycerol-3-phosphate transport system substrate-binding protein